MFRDTLLAAFVMTALLALAAPAADNELSPQEKADGWKLLFDGRTLDGWKAAGKPEGWAVEEGAILCTVMGGSYLYTPEQYGDFTLSIDFKIAPRTNSGVFFRWSDLKNPVHTGIEMAIDDSSSRASLGKHDTGAIYDLVPPAKRAEKPA